MMNELKELLNKGGEKVFTRYAVEIGDALWNALYSHVEGTYGIESVCEDREQKFAVLSADENYYRLNFSISEDGSVEFAAEATLLEGYTPDAEPQFSAEAVAEYAKAKKDKEEEKCPKCGKPKSECTCKDDEGSEEPKGDDKKEEPKGDDKKEEPKEDKKTSDEDDDDDEEKCPDCGKPKSKCTCKKKDKKEKYNLDEIQEYVELSEKYSNLENSYNEAKETITNLESQISELTAFKKGIEKAEKQKMIDSFCMLSDAEKADVIENIDTYSLDDIEAKLSIICVRNKVSFNLDDDKNDKTDPTTFNLDGGLNDEAPAWVKAIRSVASNM